MPRILRIILIAIVFALVLFSGFCGYKVHELSNEQKLVRADYSVVNNISFGLLSVSQWRDQVVDIVSKQIQNFDLTKSQEAAIKKQIEGILHALISKAIGEVNKPNKTLGGKLKKLAFKAFVDTAEIHSKVPIFAAQIIAQIKKPSTKAKLKGIAEDKLQELGKQTYDSSINEQEFVTDSIYKKYQVADVDAFETKSTSMLYTLREQTYHYAFGMLLSIVVILLLWIFFRKQPALYVPLFILSVLSALTLLLVGITTTMIQLDARIKSLDFHLMGTTISFKNQVLFYQSKSILDVVKVLIDTGQWDMIIVGALVLCFSVVFPFAKLTSTCIYLLGKGKFAKSKVIQFFAFKSGKWSMADVMVVGIMMTYIGFNGVISSQLADLNINDETMTSITTNNTSLQPGYIIFVGFVVYGLILSQILKYITGTTEEVVVKEMKKGSALHRV